MASNNPIHRLNLVDQSPSPTSLADTQDILSIPPYADLAAQLDLWTHVSFATDEPFAQNKQGDADDNADKQNASSDLEKEEIKRKRQLLGGPKVIHELPTQPQPTPLVSTVPAPFDLQSFLALAGMAAAPMPLDTMNLNNILALAPYTQSQFPAMVPGLSLPPAAPSAAPSVSAAPAASATPRPSSSSEPPAKRARTRKSSVGNSTAGTALSANSTSTPAQPLAPAPTAASSSAKPPAADADDDHDQDDDDDNSAPHPDGLNPAEDKRRRNTQASARFRLKKKEREAAMEQKCKDLEAKVSELERECEALRRENGWLKGLVVGVTGGTGGMSLSGPPSLSRPGAPAATTTAGEKRKRDGVDRH
ncbi:hypothetical protein FRC03_010452 [Tulasnella sp. 419]|nr:hypothetical protein FRC03_010452 [Tulasnella sp. 419]